MCTEFAAGQKQTVKETGKNKCKHCTVNSKGKVL